MIKSKDKEWLKKMVDEKSEVVSSWALGRSDNSYWKNDNLKINKGILFALIDQLEEPEKPVIPKFVADWYESEGKRNSWWNWFYKWGRDEHRTELETKTIRWMQDFNEELFVDMFRFGYEVEKEQKYYVLDSEDIPLLERANNQTCKTTTALSIYEDGRDNSRFALTEKEIKDYDERFWQFAEPVEEEEE